MWLFGCVNVVVWMCECGCLNVSLFLYFCWYEFRLTIRVSFSDCTLKLYIVGFVMLQKSFGFIGYIAWIL